MAAVITIGTKILKGLLLGVGVGSLAYGVQVASNSDLVNFLKEASVNLFNFIKELFSIFRTFFSILPGGISAILLLFTSLMMPLLIYKFFK